MSKYTIYPGEFPCHTCKKMVKTVRLYGQEKEITWMCEDRHLSSVSLYKKKTKKDYEREIRE